MLDKKDLCLGFFSCVTPVCFYLSVVFDSRCIISLQELDDATTKQPTIIWVV